MLVSYQRWNIAIR